MDTQEELKHWLILALVPKFGGALATKLLQQVSLAELFNCNQQQLEKLGLKTNQVNAILNPDWLKIEKQLAWLDTAGNKIVTLSDPNYPPLLIEIASPPLVLYIQGCWEVIHFPQLAIVGTRNPTATGKETAYQFAKELSAAGLTVTSGLASGIDGYAHQAAVDVNKPTVAVMGAGLDNIYPRKHRQLAESILDTGGILVSEFSPEVAPLAQHFPRRNRIISGLSLGTLVVEATLKSGSLITARLALEQNREVFALPWSIHSPQGKGCHHLIRQGAKLVEELIHIYEELPNLNSMPINNLYRSGEKTTVKGLAADQMLDSVGFEPTPVDSIVARSGKPVATVLQKLLELELEGVVAAVPGGYIRIRGS